MSKTIFFVRHGESEANAAGLMAGTYDTPLVDNGIAQAKKAGQDLKAKKIELIVCTPLIRTHQTAETIAKEVNYDPKKIIEKDYFTERDFGTYEGKSFELYLKHDAANALDPSVEAVEKLHARILKGFDWLRSRPEKSIVVVGHGSSGRMTKLVAQELEHSNFHLIERMKNAEIYEFTLV